MNNSTTLSSSSSSSSFSSSTSSLRNTINTQQQESTTTIPVVRLETGSTVLPMGHSMYLHSGTTEHNVSKPNLDELAMLKEMGRGLKSTLQTFLPQLAIANTELQKRIQREGNNQTVDIMNISSDVPRYIEMDVAFTELEEGAILEGDEEDDSYGIQQSSAISSKHKKKNKLIIPSTVSTSVPPRKSSSSAPLIEVLQDINMETNTRDQDDESISSLSSSTTDSSDDDEEEGKWITNNEELSIHQQAIIQAIMKDAQQAGIDIHSLHHNNNNTSTKDQNDDI